MDIAHADFPANQQAEDAQPGRISQSLEKRVHRGEAGVSGG